MAVSSVLVVVEVFWFFPSRKGGKTVAVVEHSEAASVAAKAGTFKTASQKTEGSSTISGAAVSGGLQVSVPGQSSTSRRGHDLPLPSGWRRAEDASGRVYYWHVHTRQTRWTPRVTVHEDEDEEDEEDEEVEDEDMDEIYAESRFPPLGSCPCGCACGSPPRTAGRDGGVCSLTR